MSTRRPLVYVALLLTALFYGAALAAAGGCMVAAWSVARAGGGSPWPQIVGGAAALLILWGVAPRRRRFEAPGPRLVADRQPRLFEELSRVAGRVDERMPEEVYLDPTCNAWVTARGGFLGARTKRVMVLGLPLLAMITRSQLRAVLAHELGHYAGGDEKLAGWIYQTREAIVRAFHGSSFLGVLLNWPFLLYGKLFLRITHAITRRQETAADAIAARAFGARAMEDGLRLVEGAGAVYASYLVTEVQPVLQAGRRPPLLDGFRQFLQARPIADAVSHWVEERAAGGAADPYDTHPSIHERLSAIRCFPAGAPHPDDGPAVGLLEDLAGLEGEMLVRLTDRPDVATLEAIAWTEVCPLVHLPRWVEQVAVYGPEIAGITFPLLPRHARDYRPFVARLVRERRFAEDPKGLALTTVGAWAALRLRELGWTLDYAPGTGAIARRGEDRFEADVAVQRLHAGEISDDQWDQECRRLGLS